MADQYLSNIAIINIIFTRLPLPTENTTKVTDDKWTVSAKNEEGSHPQVGVRFWPLGALGDNKRELGELGIGDNLLGVRARPYRHPNNGNPDSEMEPSIDMLCWCCDRIKKGGRRQCSLWDLTDIDYSEKSYSLCGRVPWDMSDVLA